MSEIMNPSTPKEACGRDGDPGGGASARPVQRRYASGREPVPKGMTRRFRCAKLRGRLYIQCCETGDLLYTPPIFIRITSRAQMEELANRAEARGVLSIDDIVTYESHAPRASGYSKRTT